MVTPFLVWEGTYGMSRFRLIDTGAESFILEYLDDNHKDLLGETTPRWVTASTSYTPRVMTKAIKELMSNG